MMPSLGELKNWPANSRLMYNIFLGFKVSKLKTNNIIFAINLFFEEKLTKTFVVLKVHFNGLTTLRTIFQQCQRGGGIFDPAKTISKVVKENTSPASHFSNLQMKFFIEQDLF